MKKGIFVLLLFVVFIIAPINIWAKQLVFDPSPDVRVIGYKVYYGQSTDFSEIVDLGQNTYYNLPELVKGATYYFAATAYDEFNNESVFSEILEYQVPADTIIIPTISGLGVKRLLPATSGGDHIARFTWNISDPVDGYIYWIGLSEEEIDWDIANLPPEGALYPESVFLDITIQGAPGLYWVAVAPIKNSYMGEVKKAWYKPGDVNRDGVTDNIDALLIRDNYGPISIDEPVNSEKVLSNLVPDDVIDRYDRAKVRLFRD